tara:strand:- start:48 stop:221 length:174 start_codon:yes stop_codon:yes gene_type:complete
MMTPQQMTTGMHNAGFTQFDYPEHGLYFINGAINLNEWPSDWGTPPDQETINGWNTL